MIFRRGATACVAGLAVVGVAGACMPASPVEGLGTVSALPMEDFATTPLPDSSTGSLGGDTPYLIQVGDELDIRFFYNPEMNVAMPVRPDGLISLPLVGEVKAARESPASLTERLQSLYRPALRRPEVVVIVKAFSPGRVFVTGEVAEPGMIESNISLTLLQAVTRAGGFRSSAQLNNVVVIRDQGTVEPLLVSVDLAGRDAATAAARNMPLRPNDIVIVPRTGISRLGQAVDEYIRQLIPITLSMGISYVIGGTIIP